MATINDTICIEEGCSDSKMQDFPAAAKQFLQTFYTGRGVNMEDTIAKIAAIRDGFGLRDAIVAADGSVESDVDELNFLEFYVLLKRGMIV